MHKVYRVHQFDNFYQPHHHSHYRATYFFNTLEEAEAFAKDRNDASKKYKFTTYYVVELP